METVMKKLFSLIMILSIITSSLLAKKITINNLQERKLTTSGLAYIVKANKKIIDIENLKKFNYFNRKKNISESIYYDNGTFYKKNIKVEIINSASIKPLDKNKIRWVKSTIKQLIRLTVIQKILLHF